MKPPKGRAVISFFQIILQIIQAVNNFMLKLRTDADELEFGGVQHAVADGLETLLKRTSTHTFVQFG
jgi:hypothetical protein